MQDERRNESMAIDKQTLTTVLVDRIEIIQRLPLIEREIVFEELLPTIITGVRRCGKSYLLYQKMNELVKKGHEWNEFIYINFEDERLISFDVNDFNLLLEAYYSISKKDPILFLDEIQNITGWQKFARRMADEKRIIFITGSNSKMLSNEMEMTLGGRYISAQIYPYAFKEYLKAKNFTWSVKTLFSTKRKTDIIQYFDDYLEYGGFPELANIVNKRDYLSSIYNKIFLGDIIMRHGVSNIIALEVMMKKIAETLRHPISFSRLSNIVTSVGISVGKSTIIQYLEYAKESQLIFSINNFASKLVDKVTTPKYYFVDTGLLNLFVLDAKSALLENLIAINLLKKYGRDDVYYYQDNIEVDFYLPRNSLLIQSCYSLADIKTKDREINALIKLSKHVEVHEMMIITYDEETMINVDNLLIKVIPAWKWLLMENIER